KGGWVPLSLDSPQIKYKKNGIQPHVSCVRNRQRLSVSCNCVQKITQLSLNSKVFRKKNKYERFRRRDLFMVLPLNA
ncbi:hypothetical protein HMPREF9141_2646, partial [Prevotella multiformis DSM 16608]